MSHPANIGKCLSTCAAVADVCAEIESAIKKDPRVKEVLVYGFRNRFGTQIGMKVAGEFSSADEAKQLCINVLPSFQVPSAIELLDELPKNGSGKIIRRERRDRV